MPSAVRDARTEFSADDITQERREYLLIRDAFRHFRHTGENSAESWTVMEDIITLRASFLIDRVLTGLALDFDKALALLRNFNDFISENERQQRDILVAAIENLVDFAGAEEVEMMREVNELPEEENDWETRENVCEKYNLIYADTENGNVEHAARIAAWWIGIANESVITYMTQGDERVRATHLSLEGISYRKSEFPSELIPPIEWACRCYLTSDGIASVHGSLLTKRDYKELINPVFSESLATGGRIFTNNHPYFQKTLPAKVQEIIKKIKQKLYIHDD